MQDTEYQAYVKKQSYNDLLSIRNSLSKTTYPDRYAMVIAEIEARDKGPVPPPLSGISPDPMLRPHTQPEDVSTLTKALIILGFLIQVSSTFMSNAETEAFQMLRLSLALIGGIISAVGTARYARNMGYSRWLGVLGLLGIIGLGLLCALPRRQTRNER